MDKKSESLPMIKNRKKLDDSFVRLAKKVKKSFEEQARYLKEQSENENNSFAEFLQSH